MTIGSDPNDYEFWAFVCCKTGNGINQHIETLFRNQTSNSKNKAVGRNG
jgi:hypothetical protein